MQNQSIRTKRTRLAATISLFLGAALLAPLLLQAAPPAGEMGADRSGEPLIEQMTRDLDLTEAQQTQIRTLMETERTQREQRRQALREGIDTLLTGEQKAKRDTMMETRLERRLDRMAERLDLTEEQVAQMKTLFEERRTNPELSRADLRERMSGVLTDEQRAAFEDRFKRHDRGGRSADCGRF